MEASRAQQIKEDMDVEWWRAAQTDQFSLRDKLMRVGCRPLKRKYLACKKTMASGYNINSVQGYGECQVSQSDFKC